MASDQVLYFREMTKVLAPTTSKPPPPPPPPPPTRAASRSLPPKPLHAVLAKDVFVDMNFDLRADIKVDFSSVHLFFICMLLKAVHPFTIYAFLLCVFL